jgi:hypothetical protein
MEVVSRKEEYFSHYQKLTCWLTFYHDPQIKACKLAKRNHTDLTWPPSEE